MTVPVVGDHPSCTRWTLPPERASSRTPVVRVSDLGATRLAEALLPDAGRVDAQRGWAQDDGPGQPIDTAGHLLGTAAADGGGVLLQQPEAAEQDDAGYQGRRQQGLPEGSGEAVRAGLSCRWTHHR